MLQSYHPRSIKCPRTNEDLELDLLISFGEYLNIQLYHRGMMRLITMNAPSKSSKISKTPTTSLLSATSLASAKRGKVLSGKVILPLNYPLTYLTEQRKLPYFHGSKKTSEILYTVYMGHFPMLNDPRVYDTTG